jgi:methyltransferase-like protein
LQCVADFNWTTHYALKAGERLKPLLKKEQPDIVLEQYCDFLVNQTFRSSVICRSDLKIQFREKDILNRYHFFLPVGCTINSVEASEDNPAALRFVLPSKKEVSVSRGPLLDLVCEYFINNRDGFFTTNDLWRTISPKLDETDMKDHLDGLGTIFSRMVQEGIITIVLRPPTDRTSDPRRPYARTFARQMLKRDALVIPNTMFEPVKINILEAKLMKQFDGRRSITEFVSDVQKEILKGRLQVGHEGETIQADQRDRITKLIEEIMLNLRNKRLVF